MKKVVNSRTESKYTAIDNHGHLIQNSGSKNVFLFPTNSGINPNHRYISSSFSLNCN